MTRKIKSILVMADKEPQIVRVPAERKFFKGLIGDDLKISRLSDNTYLIANKNARLDDFNRFLNGDIILGTFIIIKMKKDKPSSFTKKEIRKYSNTFKLRRHQKKILLCREIFLSQYYLNSKKQIA
ncbi:MAG: hypothetical protein Q4G09_00920 [Clostridia bacterium]|nr:hypothetical protein [Clostridia bacterium]